VLASHHPLATVRVADSRGDARCPRSCSPGAGQFEELSHHSYRGEQYRPIGFGLCVAEAGITAPIGKVDDSYNKELTGTVNKLYKIANIRQREPWRNVGDVG